MKLECERDGERGQRAADDRRGGDVRKTPQAATIHPVASGMSSAHVTDDAVRIPRGIRRYIPYGTITFLLSSSPSIGVFRFSVFSFAPSSRLSRNAVTPGHCGLSVHISLPPGLLGRLINRFRSLLPDAIAFDLRPSRLRATWPPQAWISW